jgi:hypothetical protein
VFIRPQGLGDGTCKLTSDPWIPSTMRDVQSSGQPTHFSAYLLATDAHPSFPASADETEVGEPG